MAPTARSAPLENFEPFARRQKHPFACTFLACGFEHQKPKRCAFSRSGEPTQCSSVLHTCYRLLSRFNVSGEPQHYHDYPLLPRRRCPVTIARCSDGLADVLSSKRRLNSGRRDEQKGSFHRRLYWRRHGGCSLKRCPTGALRPCSGEQHTICQ